MGWIKKSEDSNGFFGELRYRGKLLSSPSTLGHSVSDDRSVPFGDFNDGTVNEDGNDSDDSSVDEGIRADLISERIVDTGIWRDTLSVSNAVSAPGLQAMSGCREGGRS